MQAYLRSTSYFLPLIKKRRPKALREEPAPCEELALDTPMVQVPSIDVVGSGQELALIPSVEDACPTEDGTSTGTLGGDAIKKGALDSPSN